MIGFCGMDTQKCEKSREECEHWAKCTLAEIGERNEKGLLQIYKNRIVALELALCESEARSLLNFQRFEAAMEGEQLTWAKMHDWDACHDEERRDRIDFARRGLKAEGKL